MATRHYIVPGRYHTLIKDCSYLPGDNAEGNRHIELKQYKFIATLLSLHMHDTPSCGISNTITITCNFIIHILYVYVLIATRTHCT